MPTRWLDIFFRFSGRVYSLKQKLINSNRWYTAIYYAFVLFFTELGLVVISFPLFIIVSPDKIQKIKGYQVPARSSAMQEYILRRRIGLTSSAGVIIILFVKLGLFGIASIFLLGSQPLLADTQSWAFTTPSDYTYNTSTVEIVGGFAQLRDLGISAAGSSTNFSFDTSSVDWHYADWLQPANTTATGTYIASGGNTGGYIDIPLTATKKNLTVAGYWWQSFTTTVDSPATATLSLDWKSITFTSPHAPASYHLYAFIDTNSNVPALGTQVWDSGAITASTNWASITPINIVAKLPTAGSYFLKIAARVTNSGTNESDAYTSGFDNVHVDWSKTTHSYSTANPTTTPVSSLAAAKILSWNSFTETSNPDGGTIGYQLSGDNGINWKYWNSGWVTTTLPSNTNSSSTINTNISSFPTSTNQIKWRAYFGSNGTQSVQLSGVTINYTQNNPPQAINLSPFQYSGNGDVHIGYSLQDVESDPASLVNFEYSLTGAFAGEQVTMAASSTDPAHQGTTGLNSSPTGVAHTFAWDAHAQLGDVVTTTVFVRLRANDGISNGAFATSSAFTVDYVPPVISNVSAVETLGTSTVSITYDLSDYTTSSLATELGISSDGGVTWTVPTSSVTGNIGGGQNTGTSLTITWNAGADYPGHQSANMRVRVKARDAWQNLGTFTSSTNFSLDTLAPATSVTADLKAQPNAGDTTVLVGGSFTEANPSTNTFFAAVSNGAYGSGTLGTLNTAAPANQATAVASALRGSDFISKVKINHLDKYGNTFDNENASPSATFKYVKPYTPLAPTLANPVTTNLDLTVNPNAGEASGLEYAIYETSTGKYVQSNGTLASGAVWQVLGTGAGQWGNGSGVSGKVNVNGLSSPLALYRFQVKSRNISDMAHAVSSESALSAAAQLTNTAPSISFNTVAQTTDGSDFTNINYTGTDVQGDISSLVTYQYSLDGGSSWSTTTEKSGVGSSGTSNLVFLPTGSTYLFAWNSGLDAANVETTTAKVRLRPNDSLTNGNLITSNNFTIDNKVPVVSNVASSQALGGKIVTITYNLTDANNSTIAAEISSDGGTNWTVPSTTLSGAVGGGISPGNNKSITWNAGVDFNGQYNTNMKVRVRATDSFGNAGTNSLSPAFTVDTHAPLVSNVTATQDTGNNTFTFHYDVLEDIGTVNTLLEISSDGGSIWSVATSSVSGAVGSGVATGTGKTITWNGDADFGNQEKTTMKIRLTATDQYSNTGNNTSSNFNLDTKAPRVTSVNASQPLSTTTVAITYSLADQNNSLVQMDISADGGSTWSVASSSVRGNIGAGVAPGANIIYWNAKADFNNQSIANAKVRVRARDIFFNQSSNVTSTGFFIDTLAPAVNAAADLAIQPNAGDTTVLIGGSFTESNPSTNTFFVALGDGIYGSGTLGTPNTAFPSDQATAVGRTLHGNDYISKVKINHADKYGQTVDNENISPLSAFKYVKPYTPPAPTVYNPTVGTVDVIIGKNALEANGLEYAIFENTQSKYVQTNGALGTSAVWQALGTSAGQWGNTSGVIGKITVNGLTRASYQYQFQVKSRNPNDAGHAASSESALGSGASSANQSPSIVFNSLAQTRDGSKYVNVFYSGIDLESETSTLVTYKYSTDAVNFYTMTEKGGVGSNGTTGLLFVPSPGLGLHFMWDVNADLPNAESDTVYVRLQANDGTTSGGVSTASVITVDTKNPVISSVTASQNAGAGNVTIGYALTDLSTSTVGLDISSDGGVTWNVASSSVSGNIGASVYPGSGKAIVWNAGVNFPNQEVSNMKIQLRARDAYGNQSSPAISANFAVDTKAPIVSNVMASQGVSTSTVTIAYNLADASNSNVAVDISEDYGVTWGVATGTLTGNIGAGVTPGSKIVTWNAAVDFPNREQSGLVARVRATDVFANVGNSVSSAAFTVDTLSPRVTNVVASQTLGAQNVSITYNLSEANTSTLAFDVSSDGGSTWNVPHSTVSGDVGSGITSGSKMIIWNAGADFPNQQNSNLMVRVRGTDAFNNISSNVSSGLFSLDTLAPAVNVTTDLQSQPNAGAITALVGGSFTEPNPSTNDFNVAMNGNAYGLTTTGAGNTASPANQATNVGATLTGSDYISKVRIVETDKYGKSTANENLSPNSAFKYVKPFTPPTPTVSNPQNTSVDVTIGAHAGESASVQYAIYEVHTGNYVQANGILSSGSVWQTVGTSTGQWGVTLGVAGQVRVSGLNSPVAQYSFEIKSRNPSDAGHQASSESNLSAASGISNTAPTIVINSSSQQLGNNYVLIHYTGTDAQNDTNNLTSFEYSTDNVNWHTMTEKSGVGSSGTGSLVFASGGASFTLAWDASADLPNQENPTTYVRLRSSDTLANSSLVVSSAFAVDTHGPVISNITTSQTPGSSLITVQYNLADISGSNNNVQLFISSNGGSTFTVATSSLSGDIGAGVTAGIGRTVTWNAAVDFAGQENNAMQVELRATDAYNNTGSFATSSNFAVDTKAPVVSSVSASQVGGSDNVTVNYTLTDITSGGNLVEFNISSDNGTTWTVATATASGDVGAGITTGSKSFVWNAGADFSGHSISDMKVRVRAKDYFGNQGSFVNSSAFTLDTAAPVFGSLTASQLTASTTVQFGFNLSDTQTTSSVTAQISSNSGGTWTVPVSTLAGNIGSNVPNGSARAVTWRAGIDFAGQETNTVRVRFKATDKFGNTSTFFESADFTVDTLGPVGLANFRKIALATSSVTLAWNSGVADAHFDHYELWYGSNRSDVDNRSGTAQLWSAAQDSNLSNLLTLATTITGLDITGDFYVKIIAVDQYGTGSSLPSINVFAAPVAGPSGLTPGQAVGNLASAPVVIAQPLLFSIKSPYNDPSVIIAGVATQLSNIELFDNNVLVRRLSGITDIHGNFSDRVALGEGKHNLSVRAIDNAGNISEVSNAVTVVIDLTAPSSPLVFNPTPDAVVTEATPTLIGGTESGTKVNITLDGKNQFAAEADVNGAWQFALPSQFALLNGRHSFVLKSIDEAGNVSKPTTIVLIKSAPVSIQPEISVAPVVPVAPAISAPAAVGLPGLVIPPIVALPPMPPAIVVRANIEATEIASLPVPVIVTTTLTVSGNNFIFSGTALPNEEVIVYLHSSQALIYQTRANRHGVWQIDHSQLTTELAPGDHTIFAVAVDPLNKVKSRPSAVQTFEVKKSFWVNLFQLLNLPTTIVAIMMLGFTMWWLYRLRAKTGVEV